MLQLKVGVDYCQNIVEFFNFFLNCWLPVWLFWICSLNTVKQITDAVTLQLKCCCSLCRPEQKAFFKIGKTHERCMPQDFRRGSLAWQVIWLVGLVFCPIEQVIGCRCLGTATVQCPLRKKKMGSVVCEVRMKVERFQGNL